MTTNAPTRKISLAFLPPLLLVLAIVTFSVLFNLSIIDIRFQELDKTLYKIAHQQDLNKSLNMLAKYSIIKRRMERGAETSEDYTVESKVMAVISGDYFKEEPRQLNRWNYIHPIARIGINAIRLLMGKSVQAEAEADKENKELEVAYFYERNRRYDKALEMYDNILKAKKHTPETESYIILHKGFCESMVGDLGKARDSYEDIIKRFPESEATVVAWRLLDFINTVDDELGEAKKGKAVTLPYAKKLYLLMDYKNAITVFSELENSLKEKSDAGSKAQIAEAVFLKARSHEEMGESGLAIENYRQLLKDYGDTPWALEANRRIFILGEFYERDKEITKIALARLKKYQDDNFFDELNSYSGIIEDNKVSEEARLKQREMVRKEISKADGDVLDAIEKLDLSGEMAAEQEMKAAEEAQKIEALKQAQAKVMEKEMLDVNAHPLRKPSFIGREIKKKAVMLTTIYNQMLKKGADFSGTLKLVFSIESSGKTVNVAIDEESDIQDEEFREKVIQNVQTWIFPAIEEEYKTPQRVNYPIVFKKNE